MGIRIGLLDKVMFEPKWCSCPGKGFQDGEQQGQRLWGRTCLVCLRKSKEASAAGVVRVSERAVDETGSRG